jgi:hypothetical protein
MPVIPYRRSEALDNHVTETQRQRQSDIDFICEHMENCFYLSCCSRAQDYVTSYFIGGFSANQTQGLAQRPRSEPVGRTFSMYIESELQFLESCKTGRRADQLSTPRPLK